MIRKSIIERNIKKKTLIQKYLFKRKFILKQLKTVNPFISSFILYKKIQKLAKNTNKIRLKNRCWKSNKGKSYYRFFGLSRNIIKNFADKCILPGLIKSSW